MRYSFLLLLFLFSCVFVRGADARPPNGADKGWSGSAQGEASSPSEETVIIPGPLRSFLRMAGVSQEVTPPEVLPTLARSVILHGYHNERPMEFLVLLRRYYHQAQELGTQAGPNGKIRVDGCQNVEPLLRVLGYRMQGECGHSSFSLVTADAERAFLTIDSGFPLLDLEEALQKGAPFSYDYGGSVVPVMYAPSDWSAINSSKGQNISDLVEALIYEPQLARLYWALSQIDPETRAALKKDVGLAKLVPFAPVLNLYGSQICIRSGAVVVPGGPKAEKEWQELVGASPRTPAEFIPHLLKKDHGWLAAYFDALARTGRSQQEHFATGQRLKLYYLAFRSPGISQDAAASHP